MQFEELWQLYQHSRKHTLKLEQELKEAYAENEKLWEALLRIDRIVTRKAKEACGA